MITRRHFIATSAVLMAVPKLTFAKAPFELTAAPVSMSLLSDNDKKTDLWGYNGSTPGPTIRMKKGEMVNVNFENKVNQPSAVHWHGIRIDNKMDGVPGLTQDVVKPNQSFDYAFTVPDAGTYWYHSHNRSWEQVERGLYGALIVDEENPPHVDHDIIVFVDDWSLNNDGTLNKDFENRHDQAHDGRLGNFAKTVFEPASPQIKKNQRIRLRFINVATDRIFPLEVSGIKGKVVAYDGMPLGIPETIKDLVLAPAQRIDIIADTIGEVNIDLLTSDGPHHLGSLGVEGEAPIRDLPIEPLESNKILSPNMKNATKLELRMEGGAMSSRMMMGGMMTGNVWAFNGQSGMSEKKPFHRFKQGETAIIDLVNDTRFAHAIHLHGHHFQPLDNNESGMLRDTILLEPEEKQKIACVFNNPGKWLLHCHMLAHQASGMKTWVEVGT